jgi:RNA polymerase sigma-70 factor (sigma-E family)
MDSASLDFEEYFRGRAPALLRTAYLLTGDRHLAEDLVQDALARTHRAWRRLRDVDHADAYVRRAMYHLQISVWRRRRVAELLPGQLPEGYSTGTDHASTAVQRLALRQALLALPVRQRTAVVLRFLEDRSEADTAEIMNCSVGAIKSHTSRGLARLRQLMPGMADLTQEEPDE